MEEHRDLTRAQIRYFKRRAVCVKRALDDSKRGEDADEDEGEYGDFSVAELEDILRTRVTAATPVRRRKILIARIRADETDEDSDGDSDAEYEPTSKRPRR